jgi:hypothetical protein
MVEEWKQIFRQYGARLAPNRKTGAEVLRYLKDKYPLEESEDDRWKRVTLGNMMQNRRFAEKQPAGKAARTAVFHVLNTGSGKTLYKKQDGPFKGQAITVGVESRTGAFHVEGSSLLWDEIFAYRGLDEQDLQSFYMVAEYVNCLKRFKKLQNALI